jgi:heme-degrading monooxygenase HmoA
MSNPVIELVAVKTKPGVADADMLRASDSVMEFLGQSPGFIRRELFKTGENQWLDLVYWNSREEAEAALTQSMNQPSVLEMMQLLDKSSMTMQHLDQVRVYH